MKTVNCEDCRYFHWFWKGGVCDKGMGLRFYKPKSPMSIDYGYKRKCSEFMLKEDGD